MALMVHMNNIERQRQIELDSVRDGCVRWCQNIEYQEATDTKPYRNLVAVGCRDVQGDAEIAQGEPWH